MSSQSLFSNGFGLDRVGETIGCPSAFYFPGQYVQFYKKTCVPIVREHAEHVLTTRLLYKGPVKEIRQRSKR